MVSEGMIRECQEWNLLYKITDKSSISDGVGAILFKMWK